MRRPPPKPSSGTDDLLDQAESLLGQGQYAKAGILAESVLLRGPLDERATEVAAIAAIRQGEPERAIALLDEAKVLSFESPLPALLLANAHNWTGDRVAQKRVLREAIRCFPKCALAWAHYAEAVYWSEGAFTKATRYFKKAIRIDPEAPEARYHFGRAAFDHGDIALAKVLLREAERLGSEKSRRFLTQHREEFGAG